MYRTIVRTIEGPARRTADTQAPASLRLRPVLYAAAALADDDLPAGTTEAQYPSRLLQDALRDALDTEVARVTNWRSWRTQVRAARPELLVVLAHSEKVDGESTLQIGRQSVLTQLEITPSLVMGPGSPRPLVLLLACASGVPGDAFFGSLPASLTHRGAAAVVATLSLIKGPAGAQAGAALVAELTRSASPEGTTLGTALTHARRELIRTGQLAALVLVAHGEIDLQLVRN
jgi:hypothetical protein